MASATETTRTHLETIRTGLQARRAWLARRENRRGGPGRNQLLVRCIKRLEAEEARLTAAL